jgi:GTP-binding protein Era
MARKKKKFVSGFVSILGRPNVGKSTLLNTLIGTKVAIVSDKPQTTRTSIQGVWNLPEAQAVFLDTPGIHRPDTQLNKKLAHEVAGALEGRDLLLFMAGCKSRPDVEDERAVELVTRTKTPAIMLLNKIDLLKDKSRMLPVIEQYQRLAQFEEFIPISAMTGDGLDAVKDAVIRRLPPGPRYFPEDAITDQPERFFASEIVREKVLRLTKQEVPHSVMVQVDDWEESPKLLHIAASIIVERDGQKAIVIGTKGSRLKEIGTEARLELEQTLGNKVFLELFVKVRKNWREKPAYLSELDWKGR